MDFFGNVGLNKLISLIKSKFENTPVFDEEEEETSELLRDADTLISKIKQLYNRLKTEKVYPITKTKAVYDDNGNRLDNKLELLDTIQLTDQYQTTLSAGLMSLLNNSTLPVATTMHYQIPAELPERGWYIVSLTRSRETAYSGTAVLLKNPAKTYTVFGSIGSEPYIGNYENAIISTVSYSDTTQTLQRLIETFCCPKTPVGMTKQFVIGSYDGWFRVECNNFNNDRYTGFCFEFTTSTTPKRYSFFSMGGASSVMIPFRSDADVNNAIATWQPKSATLSSNGVLTVKNNAGTAIYSQTFSNIGNTMVKTVNITSPGAQFINCGFQPQEIYLTMDKGQNYMFWERWINGSFFSYWGTRGNNYNKYNYVTSVTATGANLNVYDGDFSPNASQPLRVVCIKYL